MWTGRNAKDVACVSRFVPTAYWTAVATRDRQRTTMSFHVITAVSHARMYVATEPLTGRGGSMTDFYQHILEMLTILMGRKI